MTALSREALTSEEDLLLEAIHKHDLEDEETDMPPLSEDAHAAVTATLLLAEATLYVALELRMIAENGLTVWRGDL